MAANDYYNQTGRYNSPPSYDQVSPAHDPSHRASPDRDYTINAAYPHAVGSDPYNARYSQNSLSSDHGGYLAGGRGNDADQYSENIPLKPNAQYSNAHYPDTQYSNAPPPDWMQQPTHYPPPRLEGGHVNPTVIPGTRKKKGFFKKKIAWVTYLLTTIQIAVFIAELVKNAQLTGSPIEIHPSFNPMIGPSPYVQINMGSRFIPCMKNVDGVQNANEIINWNCPNTTTTDANAASNHCTLSELCGFSGVPNPKPHGSLDDRPEPNQWFRFIIPMFLHGGVIHIGFNLLVQMTMGADMERMIGWWRYAICYLASGIWGFVLGGNYAAQGISSTGCSGSLFGILALYLLDLLYTWKERQSPWTEFIIMLIGVGISFFLGLLPGLDNFSHIGGFVMGLALGLLVMRSPNALRERIGLPRHPYVAMSGAAGPGASRDENKASSGPGIMNFFKGQQGASDSAEGSSSKPMNFFKGRKPLWWAWWLVRMGALVAVVIGFIMLIVNFYKYPKSNCSWCYRLSCLPIKDWCEQGNLQLKST